MTLKSKLKINLILSIFIPFLLFAILLMPTVKPNSVKADEDYVEKIVAVVYDDSGSMQSSGRYDYAKYAMQVLMATLDSRDVLKVFPLNRNAFEVDLASDDREQEIKNNVGKFYASGGTPAKQIGNAISWLENEHGLNKYTTIDSKEFKLIIITDGEYDECYNTSLTTSKLIGDYISGYMGLQTSFFGICLSNSYKIDTLEQQNSSVKAYYANSASQIVEEMQKITNATTGRYQMTNGVSFDSSNNNVVYIDLNQCSFSVKSISILAQNNSSTSVKLKSIESVTTLDKSRESSFGVSSYYANLYGYSVLLKPKETTDTANYISKEKLKLTFESKPSNILILLEPAIKMESTLQYYDGNSWVDITEQEINSDLRAGNEIRTNYKLLDANTNADITSSFNDVDVSVSYNNTIYDYNDAITLQRGKSEVALSVSVNISGSKYILYDSWACDIDDNPEHYSVVPIVTKNYDGNANRVKIDYNITFNYEPVHSSRLESSEFTWKITSLIDPNGKPVSYQSNVTNGKISIIFDMDPATYGEYKAEFQIVWTDGEVKKLRTNKTIVEKKLEDLQISQTNTNISLTTYELTKNNKAFTYTLTDNGYPINYDSNLVDYSFKIGNVDLTNSVSIKDNKLTFIPNGNMTEELKQIGSYNVVLKVWSTADNSLYETATSKLVINRSNITVKTSISDGVNGDDNKVKVDFIVYCNNVQVTESDLKGLDAVFKISNVKVIDPQGANVVYSNTISGATVSIVFDKKAGYYGTYKTQLTVEKTGDNNPITTSVDYNYYISNLQITNGANTKIELNQYQIDTNTKAFEFSVTDRGYLIDFNSSLINYKLTIGGVNVTNSVRLEGNKLIYVPNSSLPSSLRNVKNYSVVLDVWSTQNSSVRAQSTLSLNIVSAPKFEIVESKTDGVNGNYYKGKFNYTIYYNGKEVSQSDLNGSNFSYEIVEFKGPNGKVVNYTCSVVGGTISLLFDKVPGEFGQYIATIKVTENFDKRSLESTQSLEYYLSNLVITNGTYTNITLNEYQIDLNDKAFEFYLTDNGHPIDFDVSLVTYKLKIGGVDVTSSATIEGNKLTYLPNNKLPVSLRNINDYNVVLEVNSVRDATKVKAQSTLKLKIIEAPSFRIVPNTTDELNGDFYKAKFDYTVYYDGKEVSQTDLTGNTKFSWSVIEMVGPKGQTYNYTHSVNGGTISLLFDKTPGEFGVYKSKIKVVYLEYGQTITSTAELKYYISDLTITNGNYTEIELNSYQINSNTKPFEFIVTEHNHPINFDSGLINYTLTVGGEDVRKGATIDGNKIKYVPNSKLSSNLQKVGSYDVVFEVWYAIDSNVKSKSTLKLKIVESPSFNIVTNITDGVNGDAYKVKVDYTIYYDGKVISDSDITGDNPLFSWSMMEMLDPNGNSIQCTSSIMGGTISISFDKQQGNYGIYKSKIKVTKIDYNQTLTSNVEVNYVITDLIVENGNNKQLDLNLYQLQSNTEAFEFTLTDDGYPINFNSVLVGYTLKIGGVDVTNSVIVNGNTLKYTPSVNLPTSLQKVGNYDVVLDVWSTKSNAKAQSILKFNILKAPNFNIVTNSTIGVDGDDNKAKVDYTVYYDDKVVNESDLSGSNAIFSWSVIELKDPTGKDVTPLCSVSGGTISLIFEIELGNYGVYTSKLNITKTDDNRPVVSEAKVEYDVSKLVITKLNSGDITLNSYELMRNDKAFEFSLTDNGYPINFNRNDLIGYSLKIGNIDVTNNVVVTNNTLKYVPNSNMPKQLQNIADYAVVLDVWSIKNPNIKESSISKLAIVKAPNFSITAKSTVGVNGDDNKIKVDYTVYYDDKVVAEDDLKVGANQVFRLNKVEFAFTENKNFTPQYTVEYSGGTISVIFDKQTDKFGVYTAKIYLEKIDDMREIESEIQTECFLTNLKVIKGDDNDVTLTTHQLLKNDKTFEFRITNEDMPINFNSGLVGYTLKIDGVDLTDKVIIQNNFLGFTPNTSTLPVMLQDATEKEVVFEVWSIQNPTIRGKAVSKLNLTKSVYVVQSFNGEDTIVDIYDLKNSSVKVYYKISVDGHELSKQELIDGLNDGLIKIDTKPFGWILLLPTAITTEVVSYKSGNAICLSIGTNWPSPLDNLFASFIFTGDKTITLSCVNASGECVINLAHVDFLSRLWRWAVIIVTVYFIVHTILWIIGFFVAKSINKGVLVQMKLNPDKPKFLVNINSCQINTDKKAIILWHLKRYIPFMEFKDQKSISKFNVTLKIQNRNCVMVHGKPRSIIKLELDDDEASDLIKKYRRAWQDYDGGSVPRLKLTTKQLINLVDDVDKEVKLGQVVGLTETYYATKNNKGKIDSILFFKNID